ncbi:ketoacyl-ACP synthase III family protein [Kutzneria sp. NPDC052558]|uniref:ketoacyl-ACP synthase III family protein n=1 Tax=Kutzneria sp. NPDC052558 TaxID=3364121 RepID=UPI0037C5B259
MRYRQPLYLSAPTARLGERSEPVADAVAAGSIKAEVAEKYGYTALTATELAPVELAERAALTALADSGVAATELDRVFHAWTYFQGHDFWSPAHYVASRIGAVNAVPMGIQQMCNGGMAAVETAARELVADPSLGPVLVTTADRFAPPGFDRWGGDLGVCYGDGATAVVIDRVPHGRSVRLLATETVAAAQLEAMHRGDLPFTAAPVSGSQTLRPGLTKRQFNESPRRVDLAKIAHDALVTVLTKALADVAETMVAGVALPRLSRNGLDEVYRPAIDEITPATVFDLGTATGHLGAGDAVANLADLLAADPWSEGELFLLISAGAGFTWSAAVVEVV